RKIDFRNTIIIMTSNLGSDLIRRSSEVGFGALEGMPSYDIMKEKIHKAVKKHFKDEFINRLDDMIIFKALDKAHLSKIIDLEMNKLKTRLERKGISISVTPAAKELLVEMGFQPEMGARTLRRIIEQKIEDPLAEKLLLEGDEPRHLIIDAKEQALTFTEEKGEKDKLAGAITGEKEQAAPPQ
ncbi:MAG: ATP-dependent Clp protease ATP-binding subunit, partial [Simkania negevensis]|nr:ATP-dependent Clp protease ATP-binding subunit [Simkania negevensis]